MYLQTSRLQYNLQGVVSFQTAFSKKQIRLSPYAHFITELQRLQYAVKIPPRMLFLGGVSVRLVIRFPGVCLQAGAVPAWAGLGAERRLHTLP